MIKKSSRKPQSLNVLLKTSTFLSLENIRERTGLNDELILKAIAQTGKFDIIESPAGRIYIRHSGLGVNQCAICGFGMYDRRLHSQNEQAQALRYRSIRVLPQDSIMERMPERFKDGVLLHADCAYSANIFQIYKNSEISCGDCEAHRLATDFPYCLNFFQGQLELSLGKKELPFDYFDKDGNYLFSDREGPLGKFCSLGMPKEGSSEKVRQAYEKIVLPNRCVIQHNLEQLLMLRLYMDRKPLNG